MPQLDMKSCHEFWTSYNDMDIYRAIAFMEGVEEWTLDGDPDVEQSIAELGLSLDKVGEVDLSNEQLFVEIVAHIKTGRGLRLLMALDSAYPGAAAKVLMHAEDAKNQDNELCKMFMHRNMIFERIRLLSRIFSEERFKLVTKALEEAGHDL
jgi:intracellular multiplication protein IcmW